MLEVTQHGGALWLGSVGKVEARSGAASPRQALGRDAAFPPPPLSLDLQAPGVSSQWLSLLCSPFLLDLLLSLHPVSAP